MAHFRSSAPRTEQRNGRYKDSVDLALYHAQTGLVYRSSLTSGAWSVRVCSHVLGLTCGSMGRKLRLARSQEIRGMLLISAANSA